MKVTMHCATAQRFYADAWIEGQIVAALSQAEYAQFNSSTSTPNFNSK